MQSDLEQLKMNRTTTTECDSSALAISSESGATGAGADLNWIENSRDGENASLLGRLQDCRNGLWQGRSLAWRLFVRNLQGEFRQSLLGWLWIFLPALANAGVWVLLNSSGTVRISSMSGFSYAAFVFLGTVLWQGFTDGLMSPMNTLQSNRSALTKLPFPKEVFVLVSVMETSFDLLARSLIATVLLACVGMFHPIGAVLLLCLWGPLLVCLGVGAGLLLAPFGLLYKDVSKTLTMLMPVLMLLTPVIYPMPENTAGQTIAWVNPASALIHEARSGVMGIESLADSSKAEATEAQATEPNAVAAETDSSDAAEAERELKPIALPNAEPISFLLPAMFWGIAGVVMLGAGTLWLRVTSPIIIERLAN